MRALRNGALGLMAVVLLLASPGRWAHAEPGDPPVGTITDFGVQQTALTIYEGYLGTGKDGAPMWYGVQMGEPGVLVAVDPVSRTLVDSVELAGSSGAWGVTQGSDGTVYAGSYSNAHLYSYDPESGESQDLGAPVPGAQLLYGLKAGDDGTIYGGTYPGASAFSYSPREGFTNYGTMYEGEE